MKSLQKHSAHRHKGWKGQYDRMIRWSQRFQRAVSKDFGHRSVEIDSHEYFDTLFSCLQNIFFLKDWLLNDSEISSSELNHFINSNPEMGLCRDICNGTKHFEINHPSVDAEFSIIREYDPFHDVWNTPEYFIVILAGGEKYQPFDLINKCIDIWNKFLRERGLL